jgi:hypothetical protein
MQPLAPASSLPTATATDFPSRASAPMISRPGRKCDATSAASAGCLVASFPFAPIGPMTGPPIPTLSPPQTDAVRIASYGGRTKFALGGLGPEVRYPVERAVAAAQHESFSTVKSPADLFKVLQSMKQANGNHPLSKITLSLHGSPNTLHFADGHAVTASMLGPVLVEMKLLKQGGELNFASCLVAGTPAARSGLRDASAQAGIKIVAADTVAVTGLPTFLWTFDRGNVSSSFGP